MGRDLGRRQEDWSFPPPLSKALQRRGKAPEGAVDLSISGIKASYFPDFCGGYPGAGQRSSCLILERVVNKYINKTRDQSLPIPYFQRNTVV